MKLKVVYNSSSLAFLDELKLAIKKYPLLDFESYNEDSNNDRKTAFKIKGTYGTKNTPFAILIDDDKYPVTGFYKENNTCTVEYICIALNSYILYKKKDENIDNT